MLKGFIREYLKLQKSHHPTTITRSRAHLKLFEKINRQDVEELLLAGLFKRLDELAEVSIVQSDNENY